MRNILPDFLWSDIRHHFRRKVQHAIHNYEESAANEDSLTTDLCAALRKRINRSLGPDNEVWGWRIRYRKLTSGGEESEEHVIGADGIFQIEIYGRNRKRIEQKGLLFQSKKHTNTNRAETYRQLGDMEKLVPNGSALIEFGPDKYRAIPSATVAQHRDRFSYPNMPFQPLDEFLADAFIGCEVGKKKLYYDFDRRILIVPSKTDAVDLYNVRLNHKLTIEVHQLAPLADM